MTKTKEEIKEYQRQWRIDHYEEHKIYMKEYLKKYRKEHKEKIRAIKKRYDDGHGIQERKYRKKYRKTFKYRYNAYRARARQKGREFSLTFEEFSLMLSSICYYCGSSVKIGIDRKDNSQGYLIDNSTPCCWRCNRGKGTMHSERFIAMCKEVATNPSESG